MKDSYLIDRAIRQIDNIIFKLELDLCGTSILTEAGTNHFIFTPLIAYRAGAKKIFVWLKDTGFGNAENIYKRFIEIATNLNLDISKFEFGINKRPDDHIRQSDIITNLGSVRPINKEFIDKMKPNAVISYMCEAWEIRPQDVDIEYCKQKKNKIAGVWENHPDLLIFNGCGPLSLKVCFEAGLEIYQNKILIISSDKFGSVAEEAFQKCGASEVKTITPELISKQNLETFDIIFVADYSYAEEIIGRNLVDRINELKKISVIHLCGSVDFEFLESEGIHCFPKQNGYSFRMTRTLAYLGSKSVIDLHAAGLKVGQCLFKSIPSNLIQLI